MIEIKDKGQTLFNGKGRHFTIKGDFKFVNSKTDLNGNPFISIYCGELDFLNAIKTLLNDKCLLEVEKTDKRTINELTTEDLRQKISNLQTAVYLIARNVKDDRFILDLREIKNLCEVS